MLGAEAHDIDVPDVQEGRECRQAREHRHRVNNDLASPG
jgi:hypothetical protein